MKNDLEKNLIKLNKALKEQEYGFDLTKRPYPIRFIELEVDDIDRNKKLKQ